VKCLYIKQHRSRTFSYTRKSVLQESYTALPETVLLWCEDDAASRTQAGQVTFVASAQKKRALSNCSHSTSEEWVSTWKWPKIAAIQDGEVYQISVGGYRGVISWMRGSVEALVEMRRVGLRPEARTEILPLTTIERARFEIRRPDMDGNLDWSQDDSQRANVIKPPTYGASHTGTCACMVFSIR
jgi:hypothetical protein